MPVIDDWNALRDLIRSGEIDEVWLTLPMSHEWRIQRIVRELRDEFVELRLLPDVRQMAVVDRSATDVLGMPAINPRPRRVRRRSCGRSSRSTGCSHSAC